MMGEVTESRMTGDGSRSKPASHDEITYSPYHQRLNSQRDCDNKPAHLTKRAHKSVVHFATFFKMLRFSLIINMMNIDLKNYSVKYF